MRILHTAATYAPSLDGVAQIVRNISERLAKKGHDVHVATAALNSQHSYVRLNGVQVYRFNVRGSLALGIRGDAEKYCDSFGRETGTFLLTTLYMFGQRICTK